MKAIILILLIIINSICAKSQLENDKRGSASEQQLENMTEQQEGEPEDDSYQQALIQLQKNKINLNTAEANDLHDLPMLSDLQIESLLSYRRLLGSFISVYELQAVPLWNIETIRSVLPYAIVGNSIPFSADMKQRFAAGQHSVLLRAQQVLEKSDGFVRPDSIAIRYPGSQQRVIFRYKYVYRNLLQFGVTADKDAGEQFFNGNQKKGFDFYSFHLFARNIGKIKLLALGDFTVNLGQGLIHWQSLAFKKSSDITSVKRQADILRPYNSPGEYNFMRGAGITAGFRNIDVTAFASVRKLDAGFNDDTSQSNDDYISSILNSGYHRTANEVAKKNALTQTSFGGNISYAKNSFHIGVNGIGFKFSVPLIRDIQPYNRYSIQGKEWYNYSVDYSYTFRNFHFFGEAALDKNNSKAFIGGLIASLDQKADVSLVYRNIEKSYQTLYGNAFTESIFPTNEKGLFTGITLRPATFLKIDAYADVFSFPWLRYRVDAPSKGSEYLLQITYKPNKKFQLYTRFRNENKPINISGLDLETRPVSARPRTNWRTEYSYNVNRKLTLRQRAELIWFDIHEKDRSPRGFLTYLNIAYKPLSKPVSINGRLQFFNTDGFDSRLYSFENDVLYSYSIPEFIGKGLRYYVNINYDVNKKMTLWFRWAQTVYANKTSIGTGLDEIKGNKKSEVKLQVLYNF